MDEILYKIGISLLPGIGPVKARSLVSYVGSPKDVFFEKKTNLQKIPGIGPYAANNINFDKILKKAERELEITQKNNIKTLFYLDNDYPKQLSPFEDAPVILYQKGDINFNENKFLSIVGTRSMTHYGSEHCHKIISDLSKNGYKPVIVSGMAYGLDYCAHSAAMKNALKTVAVLGHGFAHIYPAAHREIAQRITKNGALITEFPFNSKIDSSNFVKRNRIIAAISEATIIVESAKKGGSLITAEYAVQYAKDVFTFPGRIGDKTSEGCNFLIKTNRAALIENYKDLVYNLRWEKNTKKVIQPTIFNDLSKDEQKIVDLLKKQQKINVDVISYETNLPINNVMSIMFNLEFKNIVKALPGRMYSLSSG